MASIRKRNSRWEARVRRTGFATKTKSFDYKSDAIAWASETELSLHAEVCKYTAKDNDLTLAEAAERYIRDVSAFHKGFEVEKYRLRALVERLGGTKALASISSSDVSTAKTERLRGVSSGTVRRELNLLSSMFETARNEWGCASINNPVRKVKRPPDSEARQRRLSATERNLIISQSQKTKSSQLHLAILFALETAMRQGEILKLRWSNINLDKRTISVTKTKNSTNRIVVI